MSFSASVHIAAVGDPGDDDEASLFVDGKDEAVLADSDPVVVSTSEPDDSRGTGIDCERVDCGPHSLAQWALELAVCARRLAGQPYPVSVGRCALATLESRPR